MNEKRIEKIYEDITYKDPMTGIREINLPALAQLLASAEVSLGTVKDLVEEIWENCKD